MSFEIGSIVSGKYEIQRVLGQGGMGTVFLAKHLLLDRSVAIKLLHTDTGDHPAASERLLREGRALARLRGEHIARVLDVEAPIEGPCFLVLEYLEGEDLGAIIRRDQRIAVALATGYVIETCEALAEAHAQGIIHRDIKPSNLFLTTLLDGSRGIKVIDFGISRQVDQAMALTQSRSILGSPCYMAPEQMRANGKIDHRCDIWALGVVLYEMLTGQLPHQGNSMLELCASILESPPKSPMALRPDVPASVDAVVRRCLARDPEQRFETVEALARALAPFSGTSTERLAWILPEPAASGESGANSRAAPSTPRTGNDARVTQTEGGAVAPHRSGARRQIGSVRVSVALIGGMVIAIVLLVATLLRQGSAESVRFALPSDATRTRNGTGAAPTAVSPQSEASTLAVKLELAREPVKGSVTRADPDPHPVPPAELERNIVTVKAGRTNPRPNRVTKTTSVSAPSPVASANAVETDPVLQYGHY